MSDFRGKYRNHAGAEIEITHVVAGWISGHQVLGTVYSAKGAAWDIHIGPREIFITPEGIKECGYVKIEDAA